jgi:hypothetical protein
MSLLTKQIQAQILAATPLKKQGQLKKIFKAVDKAALTPEQQAIIIKTVSAIIVTLPGVPPWLKVVIDLLLAGLPK